MSPYASRPGRGVVALHRPNPPVHHNINDGTRKNRGHSIAHRLGTYPCVDNHDILTSNNITSNVEVAVSEDRQLA